MTTRPIEALEQRTLLAITPVPFQHFTIDNSPGLRPLEKGLMDVDGDGNLDAVVGFDNGAGPGGIVWYQFPHSGNPADKWNKYTIAAPGGKSYEDMLPYDLNGDGAMDLIASYNGNVVWFENPRGSGGNPTTSGPWVMHTIGPGQAHELAMADFDGDGKIDIASYTHIYFQNSPTSWTTINSPMGPNAEKGVGTFDSGSGLGKVDLLGASPVAPYDISWFQNPRDIGGNARTDAWVQYRIGPSYSPTDTSLGTAFLATDVNGDGRQDVITGFGEGNSSPQSGLYWWQAPQDRTSNTWIKHVIDQTISNTHKLSLADMNNDGHLDIVFTEQDQSAQDRVGIYYNVDGTGNNWQLQVLSVQAGHNQVAADINGDGAIDIFSSPHGVYNNINPLEVYMSELKGVTSHVPTAWTDSDIGAPAMPGSAGSTDGRNWTITGGGADIGGTSDQFNYAYSSVGSNDTLIADATQITQTDAASKTGLMFRASTDPGAAFADVVLTPLSGVLFQWRSANGGATSSTTVAGLKVNTWLKLVRSNTTFTAYYSSNGLSWTQIGTPQTVNMPTNALGGLAATAKNNGMLNTGVFTAFSMSGGVPQSGGDLSAPVYVSDLPYTAVSNGWGPVEKDTSNGENAAGDGHVITLNGQFYSKGLGVNAAADVRANIAGTNYSAFMADIGVDDEVGSNGSVDFQVWLDSNLAFDSGVMTGNSPTQSIAVPIPIGVSTLRLVVTDGGNGNASDHADWANARLIKFAYAGDVNLDGRVDVADLFIMAQHYNTSGNSWTSGDVNHDGLVNIADLTLLAQTWGDGVNGSTTSLAPLLTSLGLSQVNVPQPVAVPPTTPVYLSDLPITVNANGWGPAELDQSNGETGAHDGHKITLNGQTYAKGLGVHATSDITFVLNGQYSMFFSDVGVDDEVSTRGSVDFKVYVDGVLKFDSGTMTGASATQSVGNGLGINVTGAQMLHLVVTDAGNGNASDHADWAGARLLAGQPVTSQDAPIGLSAVFNPTTKQVDLSWTDKASDEVGFRIERKTGVHGTYAPIVDIPTADTQSYSDANLTGVTTYYYRVYSYKVGANSSYSNETSVAVPALPGSYYLSDLPITVNANGWGPAELDHSNGENAAGDGHTITLNGQTYAKGLGVHAASDITFNLNGQYSTFFSDVGVDDEVGNNGSVDFQVYVDGVLKFDSGRMTGASATQSLGNGLGIDVTGAQQLHLVVTNAGDGIGSDHADWAGARLVAT